MEAATPKLQPVRQPPQTEQGRAGYSVQVENWAQQTKRPHVQQVQGWRVWDVPMQRRHHDCRTSTAALSTIWCYEAGHMAGSDASEGQAVWQPGGAEEDSRLREGNRHLHLAYDEEEEEEAIPLHDRLNTDTLQLSCANRQLRYQLWGWWSHFYEKFICCLMPSTDELEEENETPIENMMNSRKCCWLKPEHYIHKWDFSICNMHVAGRAEVLIVNPLIIAHCWIWLGCIVLPVDQ